eukprot:COSAG02_NODE_7120_length_3173_cov_33.267421_4_plen_87_part_00
MSDVESLRMEPEPAREHAQLGGARSRMHARARRNPTPAVRTRARASASASMHDGRLMQAGAAASVAPPARARATPRSLLVVAIRHP